MPLPAGSRLGRYEIVALLGIGGMGEVYRARDTQLERDVAIKVLTPSGDGDLTPRVLREARAASALNHPNVVTIYEVGQHDDTDFIVMECVDGEPLDAVIAHGPLEFDRMVDYGVQIAEGLAAVHANGLVHRDVKPRNVMVTPLGQLKLLDFGVARHARAAEGATVESTLAQPGAIIGTIGYIAPELLEGAAADARSDVFALGATLYQLISGKRPFEGDSDMAVIAATLRDAPSSLAELRPDVPLDLARIVGRCLARRPEDRYPTAREVARELTGLDASMAARAPHGLTRTARAALAALGLIVVASATALVWWQVHDRGRWAREEIPRFLVVLPFANTSPDAENEFFADGVTDDILSHLALVPDFSVISRTTAMSYKGSDKSIRDIAGELGVGYVLEGSVRRAGDQVRVTARLVDGQADQHLWAETYDRELEDIFAVQTDIAGNIVDALEVELSGSVAARIEQQPTEDLEAYELFLLGRESLYRYDVEGHERAMKLFEEAVERDPEFALARAWLARAYALYSINHGMGSDWADSAVAEARQAVEEQPELSDAHLALGTALTGIGRYEQGVPALERAIELNPNDWAAMVNLGSVYQALGRRDEAIRVTRRSLERDPVRAHYAYANLSISYTQLELYDRAESALERALALAPNDAYIMWVQAWVNLLHGRRETALQVADRLVSTHGDEPRAGWFAAMIFAFAGEAARARTAAQAAYALSPTLATDPYLLGVLYGYALERTGERERAAGVLAEAERYAHERIDAGDEMTRLRYSLACIHAMRGERDQAFHWLDEAIRLGWNVAGTTVRDPLLESLRDDPRFQTALDRMERDLAPMRTRVERESL